MPIDAKSVQWDAPDEKSIQWDDTKKPFKFVPLEEEGRASAQKAALDLRSGLLRGAGSIGATLLWPADKFNDLTLDPLPNGQTRNEQRRQQIDEGLNALGADTDSLRYKGGKLASEIAGTAGMGSALGRALSAIPGLAKFAPALESGGFTLGPAATSSPLANTAIRAGAGAATGGATTALVEPDKAGPGALIGAAAPGVIQLAGGAGNLINQGLEGTAKKLMTSAIKPTIKQHGRGEAERAVNTLLAEGISPTRSGVNKLQQRVDDINSQVDNLIQGSNATVDQAKVVAALSSPRLKFGMQVDPSADLAAIDAVENGFMNNPVIAGNPAIPVDLAQELKKGTYRVLNGKYGEIGSASTEAQKALARGLKEEIEAAVPQVGPLNSQERELLNALEVAQRRVLMNANNNPIGLTPAMGGNLGKLAFLLDRSVAAKALAARGAHQLAQNNPIGNLPNMLGSGLYGIPSIAATSP